MIGNVRKIVRQRQAGDAKKVRDGQVSLLAIGGDGSFFLLLFFKRFRLLALLLLGHIPAVGALYRSLGLDIFADVPFFTGFTLRSALLLCYVGVFCAAIGFLLTAKITEYTSATEASFVYLIKPVLATLLAVVCFHEAISVNRMIGLVFFLAASLCVSVPVLREMRRDAVTAQPPR